MTNVASSKAASALAAAIDVLAEAAVAQIPDGVHKRADFWDDAKGHWAAMQPKDPDLASALKWGLGGAAAGAGAGLLSSFGNSSRKKPFSNMLTGALLGGGLGAAGGYAGSRLSAPEQKTTHLTPAQHEALLRSDDPAKVTWAKAHPPRPATPSPLDPPLDWLRGLLHGGARKVEEAVTPWGAPTQTAAVAGVDYLGGKWNSRLGSKGVLTEALGSNSLKGRLGDQPLAALGRAYQGGEGLPATQLVPEVAKVDPLSRAQLEAVLGKHRNEYLKSLRGPKKLPQQPLPTIDLGHEEVLRRASMDPALKGLNLEEDALRDFFDKRHGVPGRAAVPGKAALPALPREELEKLLTESRLKMWAKPRGFAGLGWRGGVGSGMTGALRAAPYLAPALWAGRSWLAEHNKADLAAAEQIYNAAQPKP